MKLIFLILLMAIQACDVQVNKFDRLKEVCGEASDPSWSLLKFRDFQPSQAFILEQDQPKNLTYTAKSCIRVPKASGQHLHFKGEGLTGSFVLNKPKPLTIIDRAHLTPYESRRWEIGCKDGLSNQGIQIEVTPPKDSDKFFMRYHAAISKDGAPVLAISTHQVDSDWLDEAKNLEDGTYQVKLITENLFETNLAIPPRVHSCTITLDTKAPRFSTDLGDNQSFDQQTVWVDSGKPIQISGDGEQNRYFYCLSPPDGACESNQFLETDGSITLPPEGIWRVHIFARDQTGNATDPIIQDIAIRQDHIGASIRKNLENFATNLAIKKPDLAFINLYRALELRDSLFLEEEKELFRWELLEKSWQLNEMMQLKDALVFANLKSFEAGHEDFEWAALMLDGQLHLKSAAGDIEILSNISGFKFTRQGIFILANDGKLSYFGKNGRHSFDLPPDGKFIHSSLDLINEGRGLSIALRKEDFEEAFFYVRNESAIEISTGQAVAASDTYTYLVEEQASGDGDRVIKKPVAGVETQEIVLDECKVKDIQVFDESSTVILTQDCGLYLWDSAEEGELTRLKGDYNGSIFEPMSIDSVVLNRDKLEIIAGIDHGLYLYSIDTQKWQKSPAIEPVRGLRESHTGHVIAQSSLGGKTFIFGKHAVLWLSPFEAYEGHVSFDFDRGLWYERDAGNVYVYSNRKVFGSFNSSVWGQGSFNPIDKTFVFYHEHPSPEIVTIHSDFSETKRPIPELIYPQIYNLSGSILITEDRGKKISCLSPSGELLAFAEDLPIIGDVQANGDHSIIFLDAIEHKPFKLEHNCYQPMGDHSFRSIETYQGRFFINSIKHLNVDAPEKRYQYLFMDENLSVIRERFEPTRRSFKPLPEARYFSEVVDAGVHVFDGMTGDQIRTIEQGSTDGCQPLIEGDSILYCILSEEIYFINPSHQQILIGDVPHFYVAGERHLFIFSGQDLQLRARLELPRFQLANLKDRTIVPHEKGMMVSGAKSTDYVGYLSFDLEEIKAKLDGWPLVKLLID